MNVSIDSQIDFIVDLESIERADMSITRQPSMFIGNCDRDPEVPRGPAPAPMPIIADSSLAPLPFSGASGTDADAWLRRFQNYCDYRRLHGADRLPLFRLLLVDAASDWALGLAADIADNFDAVVDAFRARFVTNAAAKTANVAALWSRKQQQGETAEDFVNAMRRLAAKIPIQDETLICHAAIRGLQDETRRFVMLRGAETIDDIIVAARLAEATAVLTPTSNDKVVLKELGDLKAMFSRLIATADAPGLNVNNMAAARPVQESVLPPSTSGPRDARPTAQYRGRGRGRRGQQWRPRYGPPPMNVLPNSYGQPYAPPPTSQVSGGFVPTAATSMVPPNVNAASFQQPYTFLPAPQTQPMYCQQVPAAPGQQATSTQASSPPAWIRCDLCGRYHGNRPCTAISAVCHRCGMTGHFARCCAVVLPNTQ